MSPGFLGLRDYLSQYLTSPAFPGLVSGSQVLHEDFAGVTCSVHIRGNRVRVSTYEGEPGYSADVEKTFAKFQQGAVTASTSAV